MLDGLLDDFALDGPPGSGQGSSRRGEGEESPRLPGEPAAPPAAWQQCPGGCRRGWGAPGLTTRHWRSTGWKGWGQRSWCHPPNHPPPPGRDKDPVRGAAAPQPGAGGTSLTARLLPQALPAAGAGAAQARRLGAVALRVSSWGHGALLPTRLLALGKSVAGAPTGESCTPGDKDNGGNVPGSPRK